MRAYKFLNAHFALKSLYERRLKISTILDLNDPFELIPYDLSDKANRLAVRNTRDELSKTRGILSFSAHWHDPVVWAHYSDKHRGICLGFEVPEEACKRIEYVSERLPFPPDLGLVHAEAMLFTKFSNWHYEEEIRIWAALNEEEDGLYFKDFDDKLRLVEVIVGDRCTVPRAGIVRALGPPSENVALAKARAAFTKFEIVVDQRGLK